MKYEKERREILSAALDMLQYSLISLSGGNIALRTDEGSFLITPSAMRYETMLPEDVVLLDAEGRVLEGCRRPSSDTKALLYLFRQRSEINALIHTHQPYATLSEALEAAIYLEEAARTYLAARALGPVRLPSKEQIKAERSPRGNYGQL